MWETACPLLNTYPFLNLLKLVFLSIRILAFRDRYQTRQRKGGLAHSLVFVFPCLHFSVFSIESACTRLPTAPLREGPLSLIWQHETYSARTPLTIHFEKAKTRICAFKKVQHKPVQHMYKKKDITYLIALAELKSSGSLIAWLNWSRKLQFNQGEKLNSFLVNIKASLILFYEIQVIKYVDKTSKNIGLTTTQSRVNFSLQSFTKVSGDTLASSHSAIKNMYF